MLKTDLIAKNPMGAFNRDAEGTDVARMGLVMARPGSGKTAILVQIALDSILRGKQVVHVSIGESIEKAKAWYDDILNDAGVNSKHDMAEVQYDVRRNRMIMTFNASTFSRPKLEERLNDLIYQDIFRPCCMIVDGLDFSKVDRQTLVDMQDLQREANMSIWFSAITHREAQAEAAQTAQAIPAPCAEIADLFDSVIMVQPESGDESKIFLNVLKDNTGCVAPGKSLRLDPTSFVVWGTSF